jgi:hypothetical protein
MIYLTPIPRLVIGVSGQRYHVKPNVVLVDVRAQDVRAWIARGQARKPLPNELKALDGHLARV